MTSRAWKHSQTKKTQSKKAFVLKLWKALWEKGQKYFFPLSFVFGNSIDFRQGLCVLACVGVCLSVFEGNVGTPTKEYGLSRVTVQLVTLLKHSHTRAHTRTQTRSHKHTGRRQPWGKAAPETTEMEAITYFTSAALTHTHIYRWHMQ